MPPVQNYQRRDLPGRGIALTIVAILILGVQDALAKFLVQDYSPFQIVMMRYWAFAAFALVLVARQAPLRQALRTRVPLWHLLRGLLLVGDIWLFALAVKTVPLGELQSISMIYPLLVTLFAIPFLGEKVGIFRLSAVSIGFVGALVIVRPGGLAIDWGVGFAVLSAVFYALYIVITRKVSATDSTATNLVFPAIIGLVLTTAVGVWHWQPMDLRGVLLVGIVMITTCLGHGAMTLALSFAPASTVQPFNYFALPWAITLSVIVFNSLIDPISMVGAAIIVAAGLAVMSRERLKARASRNDAAASLPGKE
ncbi:MAG: family transporter [Devosia sp.]|nr:family transporter [Devosia sp.]